MSSYSLTFLKWVELSEGSTAYKQITAAFTSPQVKVSERIRVEVTAKVDAPCLRDALSQASHLEGVGRFAHYLNTKSSGWYSIDVIHAIDRALVRTAGSPHAYSGSPFTPAEQVNPDIILTSVPANSTPAVIRTARRRYNRLLRLLIIREFCVANPGLAFERSDRHTHGVTVLMLDDQIEARINTLPSRHRIRVKTEEINEVIEPTDSHRFNVIVNHNLAVQAAGQFATAAALPVTHDSVMTADDAGDFPDFEDNVTVGPDNPQAGGVADPAVPF